ncbi:MAG: hypothetical protein M1616_04470 [Candidatus Thermoplasmatota archaeon]|nr:hypothetical protein [Candidatus Thermoplasmatota archaeon]
MAILSLLSANGSAGIYDPDSRKIELNGKKIDTPPSFILEPGDMIRIKGEDFVATAFTTLRIGETVKRRTQIIQPWDAAYSMKMLALKPGMRVLESGGGSGAMSSHILEAIGKTGSLITVEESSANCESLVSLRAFLGKQENWTITNSRIEDFRWEEKFDAAMLDLPEPWQAAETIKELLKPGAMLCTYLPTFNQVERTHIALSRSGFYVVECSELIRRRILVRDGATRPDNDIIGHTAFLSFFVRCSGLRY